MPEGGDDMPPEEKTQSLIACPVCDMSWPVTPEMGSEVCSRQLDIHLAYKHPLPPLAPPPAPVSGLPQDALTTFLEKQTAVLVDIQAQVAAPRVQSARLEPAARPLAEEGMSQADWRVFIHKWDVYVTSTNMSDSQKVVQLWSAISEGVAGCLVQQGVAYDSQFQELLEAVKDVCVRGHNNLVEQ